MYNLSVNGNGVNFKDLEKEIYKYACEQACKMMTEILTNLDKMLLEKRDKKVFICQLFNYMAS
jgi:alpha-D-ribose 1-methylphosphonate 5-phosphate C-P lyase